MVLRGRRIPREACPIRVSRERPVLSNPVSRVCPIVSRVPPEVCPHVETKPCDDNGSSSAGTAEVRPFVLDDRSVPLSDGASSRNLAHHAPSLHTPSGHLDVCPNVGTGHVSHAGTRPLQRSVHAHPPHSRNCRKLYNSRHSFPIRRAPVFLSSRLLPPNQLRFRSNHPSMNRRLPRITPSVR